MQRGSIGDFKFAAPEKRDKAFAEHRIVYDMINDMGPSRCFDFCASEPCKDEEAPTMAGSIAKG